MKNKMGMFSFLIFFGSLNASMDAPRSPRRSPKDKIACKASLHKNSPRTDRYMGAVSALLEHELKLRPKTLDFTKPCPANRTGLQKRIASALLANVDMSLRELEVKAQTAESMPFREDDLRSPESLSRAVSVTPESKESYFFGVQRFLFQDDED